MTEYSDQDLMTLFRESGNSHYAFNLIVRKYQEKLYWHIRSILLLHEDADDVIQNTFIKVWEGLPAFREEASLYTWLYRIATNEALNFLKKKKRRAWLSLTDKEHQLAGTLEGDPYFSGDEIQQKLQQAILKLPEKQRVVFQMKYLQEMKYEEMSEILQTSVGALKASYHHAVKKVEQFIETH